MRFALEKTRMIDRRYNTVNAENCINGIQGIQKEELFHGDRAAEDVREWGEWRCHSNLVGIGVTAIGRAKSRQWGGWRCHGKWSGGGVIEMGRAAMLRQSKGWRFFNNWGTTHFTQALIAVMKIIATQ